VKKQRQKQRLDEILVNDGLISEAQIREALLRQKAHGGKFGSQLFFLGYIDEPGLVKALSAQLHCQGVVLSNLKISETILDIVPKKVALARRVIPFEHDPENNILKIACEDPTDHSLIEELNFVACGKDVELFVAAEIALNRTITKYYLGRDISLHDSHPLEIADAGTKIDKKPIKTEPDRPEDTKPAILLVTNEKHTAHLLQSLLERDNYRVVMTDSSDEAIDLLLNEKFHTVLFKDTVSGGYIDLVNWVRKISPETLIRHYETTSSLLLNKDTNSIDGDVFLENLDLFTSLLSCKAKLPTNHSGQVGRYADELCRRLGLPDKDRLTITNAAYVHDLARFYYSTDDAKDDRLVTQLTINLLKSLNYSPEVLEMLRCTHINLPKRHTGRLPIQALGGNILAIVDLFCHNVPRNERLSLDKFDAVKKRLRHLVGKLFLAEVVEAFIEIVQEEIFEVHAKQKAVQVMIYAKDLSLRQTLELRLKNEGFGAISESSPTSFIKLYKRREPDMIILVVPGEPENITSFIDKLEEGGISFSSTPTFLLTNSSFPLLAGLLKRGIEDIIALDENLNLLFSKLRKLEIKISARAETAAEIADGASRSLGHLADMNLVDLLQILGRCRKTVRVTVQPNEPDTGILGLYLNHGQITFAEFKDLTGPEAVYEALTWTDGTWTVESVATEEFPPPNNHLPNESILTQGCLLLDKKTQAETTAVNRFMHLNDD